MRREGRMPVAARRQPETIDYPGLVLLDSSFRWNDGKVLLSGIR